MIQSHNAVLVVCDDGTAWFLRGWSASDLKWERATEVLPGSKAALESELGDFHKDAGKA